MRKINPHTLFLLFYLIAGFFHEPDVRAEIQEKEPAKNSNSAQPYEEKAILSAKHFSKVLGIGIGDPIKVRMDSLYDGFGTRFLVSFNMKKGSVSKVDSCDIGVLFAINEITGNITDNSCFNFASPPKDSGMFLLRQYFRNHDLEWEDPVQILIQGPRLLFQFPSNGMQVDPRYVAVFPNRGEVEIGRTFRKTLRSKPSTAQQNGPADVGTIGPRR
ncbi:MAG: hypothetical protein IPP68_07465 [Elusimicrobia bacterium]|nr:hypothetical protein [Elusimicrobiota bacterium]